MKLFDWLYYCIYTYARKTPDREGSDAWACIYVAFSPFMHVLFAYQAVMLSITGALGPLPRKSIFIAIFIVSFAGSFWHYGWNNNGERVVSAYQKLEHPQKYARFGRIIWWETLLVPFIFGAVFIMSQKLTGWPPHP